MKKYLATISGVAAAIGVSVAICPSAQAEPFVPCPYDPTVQGAQTQYFDQKTAELRAMQDDVNTRVLGPLSGPERDAWAASPAGLEALAQMQKIVDERDHPPQSCSPLQPVASAPYFNPGEPLQPVPGPPVMGSDIQPSNHSCADLNSAWGMVGPLSEGADLLLAIKKLPGFGTVQASQLIGCGIGQTIAGSPSDADVGFCNGVAALNPIPFAPNPCPASGAN